LLYLENPGGGVVFDVGTNFGECKCSSHFWAALR
jgi:hypothetical protein